MPSRMRIAATLAVAGVLLLAAPASASAPIVYGGTFSAATAVAHLQGAAPGDVRVRSTASWGSSTSFHYRVVVTRFDLNKVDAAHYSRVSGLALRLTSGGRQQAMIFLEPTRSNGAEIWCSRMVVGGWFPVSSSASVSTGAITFAIPRTTLAKCGLGRGAVVSAEIQSTLSVNGPSSSRFGIWRQTTPGAIRSVI